MSRQGSGMCHHHELLGAAGAFVFRQKLLNLLQLSSYFRQHWKPEISRAVGSKSLWVHRLTARFACDVVEHDNLKGVDSKTYTDTDVVENVNKNIIDKKK